MNTFPDRLLDDGILRPIDTEAGRFLGRLAGPENARLVALVGAFTSAAVARGHVCLPLKELVHLIGEVESESPCPDAGQLRDILCSTVVADHPGAATPLILDPQDNLYFNRYLQYEETITAGLTARLPRVDTLRKDRARTILERLFNPEGVRQTGPDHQWAAAALSLTNRLLVVSGGPGTGKTFTVARILAAHLALSPSPPRIGLAAPTGKAAARLKDSLRRAKEELPAELAEPIPEEASTLHRLLRFQPRNGQFARNKNNPLHLDLLVVDEASMIDVVLMAALVDALPDQCRLILFGDKNQLASVEAGNLFADICGLGEPGWSPETGDILSHLTGHSYPAAEHSFEMDDAIVVLQTSYRFRDDSGIGILAAAVNSDDPSAIDHCVEADYPDLIFHSPPVNKRSHPDLPRWVERHLVPIFSAQTPLEALTVFEQSRILCALHKGSEGVITLNRQIETILSSQGHITENSALYRGRPVMILRNDYGLELYNGDTGIFWPDETGTLQAWFPLADGTMRPISALRLPEHQTGYAITIHKSQGSEFDHVLLVLPAADTPILTRELIYTGITRARRHLTISAGNGTLHTAAGRTIQRFSGLGSKLRPTVTQANRRC